MRKLADNLKNIDAILKSVYAEPMLKMMREDMNRTAYGGRIRRYTLKYNTCHEHDWEHAWEDEQILPGGTCTWCDGDGLEPPNDETTKWQACYDCGGTGFRHTRYYRHCGRCGFSKS